MHTCKEEPPGKPSVSTPEPGLDATFDHILEHWPVLTRRGESLAFRCPAAFKPEGFFKWFFYTTRVIRPRGQSENRYAVWFGPEVSMPYCEDSQHVV